MLASLSLALTSKPSARFYFGQAVLTSPHIGLLTWQQSDSKASGGEKAMVPAWKSVLLRSLPQLLYAFSPIPTAEQDDASEWI